MERAVHSNKSFRCFQMPQVNRHKNNNANN